MTSSRRGHFDIAHAKSGLIPYLDFVMAREDCQHTKPHPEPYLTAMARHGLRPEECIVVEDSERGLAAATAAGLPCMIVLSEWTKNGDFCAACRVLESIGEVPGEVSKRTWAEASAAANFDFVGQQQRPRTPYLASDLPLGYYEGVGLRAKEP